MNPTRSLHRTWLALAALLINTGSALADPATEVVPGAAVGSPEGAARAVPEPELPEYASDPSAPEVTAANLLASEHFWPYHVELSRDWKGAGLAGTAPSGARGVLVRVEASGREARVDFGRLGLARSVPVADTNLIAQANQIRLGKQRKFFPNFIEAIGPRLLATDGEQPRPVPIKEVLPASGFLCVFADPASASFAELARSLIPVQDRAGVMTIVFPQGRPSDLVVHEKLRSLGWKVPFVFQHLAEPYTKTLFDDEQAIPFVTLQTPEGRLLLSKPWSPKTETQFAAAIDEAFGDAAKRKALPEDPAKKP